MADSKLRCVLVYRIDLSSEYSASTTMLAKYDYASDYEVHAGSTSENPTLYGARDSSYADAVSMILTKNLPGSGSEPGTIGGFKIVQSEVHQVVYGADSNGLCLAVITGLQYPTRVATQMLTQLYKEFHSKFGLQAKSAIANSLTSKSKAMLKDYCSKYSDSTSLDKASALREKVDAVKVVMQDNIASMLANIEKTEEMSDKATQLNEQANVFKKKSTDLKRQMNFKNLKLTIILVVLVAVVLVIILAPLISHIVKARHVTSSAVAPPADSGATGGSVTSGGR